MKKKKVLVSVLKKLEAWCLCSRNLQYDERTIVAKDNANDINVSYGALFVH